jgi:hypothetical protein
MVPVPYWGRASAAEAGAREGGAHEAAVIPLDFSALSSFKVLEERRVVEEIMTKNHVSIDAPYWNAGVSGCLCDRVGKSEVVGAAKVVQEDDEPASPKRQGWGDAKAWCCQRSLVLLGEVLGRLNAMLWRFDG